MVRPYRTLAPIALCLLLAVPAPAVAAEPEEPAEPVEPAKPKRAAAVEATDKPRARSSALELTRHRYGFLGGGLLLFGGLAFAYSAQGEAKRAETVSSAREMSRVLEGAQASAATANLLYVLAAVTIGYAAVIEALPPSAAEKATLTLHF